MRDVNILISNGINVKESLELFGDMATYDDSLQDFLTEISGKLANIKKYKELADMNNYAIYTHSLKSDSKYFGFEKLAELSYNHELESKANNYNYIIDNYDELIKEANRITKIVKQYLGIEGTDSIPELETIEVITDETILVVDDSDLIRNFLKKIFSDTYEVLIASDGKEAIDLIKSDTENKIVCMLLDLNMPNVDGFEVLEYFKNNNLFTKIPVSVITGNDYKEVDLKVFEYPIIDILKKPFNEKNVRDIAERTIKH